MYEGMPCPDEAREAVLDTLQGEGSGLPINLKWKPDGDHISAELPRHLPGQVFKLTVAEALDVISQLSIAAMLLEGRNG